MENVTEHGMNNNKNMIRYYFRGIGLLSPAAHKPFDWISNHMRNRYNNNPRLNCDAAKPNQTNPFTCE